MVLESDNDMFFGGKEGSKENLEERMIMTKLRATIDAKMREMNDLCWDVCIDKTGAKLDQKTTTCLNNCVDRFFDTSLFIQQRFLQSFTKS